MGELELDLDPVTCAFVHVSEWVNNHAVKPYVQSVGCPTFGNDDERQNMSGLMANFKKRLGPLVKKRRGRANKNRIPPFLRQMYER